MDIGNKDLPLTLLLKVNALNVLLHFYHWAGLGTSVMETLKSEVTYGNHLWCNYNSTQNYSYKAEEIDI